jgi:plastocyanin
MLARRNFGIWGLAFSGSLALFASVALSVPAHLAAHPDTVMSAAQMAHMEQAATAKPRVVMMLHRRAVQLTISNFAFSPANLVVSQGTKLAWTNKDGDPHTVTSNKNIWTSDALDTGNRFTRVFSTVGTFAYHCSIHPFMHGTITVQKGA